MILLDTNVVTEPLRPAPDARVIEWIDAQPVETIFLSVSLACRPMSASSEPSITRPFGLTAAPNMSRTSASMLWPFRAALTRRVR